ncbi:MAG: hypothetical protein Q7R62_02745 [bacterium]|nr:hypothetical protein [bacterium]
MISLLQKSKDYFVYIQVENSEVIFQLFRFQERAYDAVLIKIKSTSGDFKNAESLGSVLTEYINEAKKIPNCRIIIGLHSGLFSTAQTTITLRREDPRRIIDETELENLVSSGLWKVFSREQKDLARKMNIPEADAVFAGALIPQVRVDGHRVASPVGFTAHTVEFTVLYSVSSRAIYHLLASLIFGETEVYCTEIGMSELLRLADLNNLNDFLLMRVSETHTYIYASSEDNLTYVDTIAWGRNSLIGALVNELMMSRPQAIELMHRADIGLTSGHVRRRLESLLLQEVSVLLKGIGAHVVEGKSKAVYVSAPFSLPAALFGEAAARRSGTIIPVIALPDNSRGEKSQSALPLSMKTTASSISALCANAWAANRSFEKNDLHKMTKRRARWLASDSTSS